MPFGKSNSSKIFCFWVQNWCKAFRHDFQKLVNYKFAMELYVDNIFGGASTYDQTLQLKNKIIATGQATTARANKSKCHGPNKT